VREGTNLGQSTGGVPAAPTEPGGATPTHTFVNWRFGPLGANGNPTGAVVDASTTFTNGHANVYAYWSINAHTVTFNANNGTFSAPDTGASTTRTVQDGATVESVGTTPTNTMPVTTRANFRFVQWRQGPVVGGNPTGAVFTGGTTVDNAVTVYAEWAQVQHTIQFHLNGGTGTAPGSITRNQGHAVVAADLPTAPSRPG